MTSARLREVKSKRKVQTDISIKSGRGEVVALREVPAIVIWLGNFGILGM